MTRGGSQSDSPVVLADAGVLISGLGKGRGGEAADQSEDEELVDGDHGNRVWVVVVVLWCVVWVGLRGVFLGSEVRGDVGMGGVLQGG